MTHTPLEVINNPQGIDLAWGTRDPGTEARYHFVASMHCKADTAEPMWRQNSPEEAKYLADRIAACFNACAGIDDPQATIMEITIAARAAFKLLLRLRDREIVADAPEIRAIGAVLAKMGG